MRGVFLLLMVNILAYSIFSYLSGNILALDRDYLQTFGFMKGNFNEGEYWQLITSLFMHFDISHLGYNMIFLLFFGYKAEEMFGKKNLLIIYFSTGIMAGIPSFFYGENTISAGSSGAIFGILGSVLIAQRGIYPNGTKTSLFYGFIFFIFAATTGFLAHLFGLIFGFIVGYFLSYGWYPKQYDDIEEKDYDIPDEYFK